MKIKNYTLPAIMLCILSSCSNREASDLNKVREVHAEHDVALLTPEFQDEKVYFTLDDIINIALGRNLDLLVKQQEWAIQHERETGEALKMLPSGTASGVTSWRNKNTASVQEQNGQISSPIIGSPQRVEQWDITATWNLLDFGVTYYRSRQEHDRTTSLGFQTKRQAQNLILEIYKSYWKAIAALNAINESKEILELSAIQQEAFQRQIQDRNISGLVGLKSQAQLVDIEVKLTKFTTDYETAKAELAGLMGLSPFICFELSPVDFTDVIEPDDICELEDIALKSRPELFVTDLDEKINADEVRISLLQMLPSPAFFAGRNWDADRFLVHHYWALTGMRASYNLLALPSRYYDYRTAKEKKCLSKLSRMALSVGVLTQVHLAYIKYYEALEGYKLLQKTANINERLYESFSKAKLYGEKSGVELIAVQMDTLVAKINALKAYADLRVAVEFLNNAIGKPRFYEPPEFTDSADETADREDTNDTDDSEDKDCNNE